MEMLADIKDVARLSDQSLLAGMLAREAQLPGNSLAEAFGMVNVPDEVREGMDSALRYQLLCARELMARAMYEQVRDKPYLNSPQAVRDYLRLNLAGLAHECFWVIYLDSQVRVIVAEEMFRGTLTQTSVYPREIVRQALRRNAASVILAHNHPSGVSQPSRADEALTQSIKAAMSLIDVRVLDHFIVTDTQCASMAEMGLV